jgi:hypothetical protein
MGGLSKSAQKVTGLFSPKSMKKGMMGLMQRKGQELAAQIPEPVPVMPTPDDESILKAKKKSIIGQRGRRGRMSTIFTDGEGLGG